MAIECLDIMRNTDMVVVWDSSKPDKLTGGPDGVRRQPLRWFLSGVFFISLFLTFLGALSSHHLERGGLLE